MESANKTWQSYKASPWASSEDAAMKVAVMETNICKEMNSLPIRKIEMPNNVREIPARSLSNREESKLRNQEDKLRTAMTTRWTKFLILLISDRRERRLKGRLSKVAVSHQLVEKAAVGKTINETVI